MAGETYTGRPTADPLRNFNPKESEAFCEGMAHRLSDTALNAPITDNPYSDTPSGDTDLRAAWNQGWNTADAEAGGPLTPLCCALEGTVLV